MTSPTYLGDGAYCHLDPAGRVVLTTGDHDPKKADNVIVLEPEVLGAFFDWFERLKQANKPA